MRVHNRPSKPFSEEGTERKWNGNVELRNQENSRGSRFFKNQKCEHVKVNQKISTVS